MKSTALVLLVSSLLICQTTLALDKSDCKCRLPARKRIIGGERTEEIYPWLVSIRKNDNSTEKSPGERVRLNETYKLEQHVASGVVLNSRWILTAASIFKKKIADDYVVQYGNDDLVKLYDNDQFVRIEEVIEHPEYYEAFPLQYNDLALVKLKTPLTFTDRTQPACLGVRHQNSPGEQLRVVGFGSNVSVAFDLGKGEYVAPQHTRYLMGADVVDQTNSLALCKGLEKLAICGKKSTAKDAQPGTPCDGDFGSPLHSMNAGKATVVGLFSFYDWKKEKQGLKVTMCYEELGSAYVRTSSYIDWIQKHVGSGNYCQ